MREDDARPGGNAWRDALLLAAVTVALIAGLVHYAALLQSEDHATDPAPSHTTSSDGAQLDSAPSGGPVTEQSAATCWDGRRTAKLALCGLPQGSHGLRYVFPSLAEGRSRCHRSHEPPSGYDVVVSWTCSDRAAGRPVRIIYEEVSNLRAAMLWFEREYVNCFRRDIVGGPSSRGGRYVWFDADSHPAKATGMYAEFPYAVSVFAPTRQATKAAWAHLVTVRPPRAIRGTPAEA